MKHNTRHQPGKISDKEQRKRLPRACRKLAKRLKALAAVDAKSIGATMLRKWAAQLRVFATELPVTAIQDFAYLVHQTLSICHTATKSRHNKVTKALKDIFCLARESGLRESDLDWFKRRHRNNCHCQP